MFCLVLSKLGILLLARGTFGVRIFDEWVHLPENPQSMPELTFWRNWVLRCWSEIQHHFIARRLTTSGGCVRKLFQRSNHV